MAYNGAKPADDGVIALGPSEIRENFRALKDDQIVAAGSVGGKAATDFFWLDGSKVISGNMKFSIDAALSRNTTDGSDTGFLCFAGGGAAGNERGGFINVFGNEHATNPGQICFMAGYVSGAHMVFMTGNYTERFRIEYGGNCIFSGNVGIGVSPSSWSGINAVQLQHGCFAGNLEANITCNAFYASGWKRVASAMATNIYSANGNILFFRAASGNANSDISWVESMRIDHSGNVGVGIYPAAKLHVMAANDDGLTLKCSQLAYNYGVAVKFTGYNNDSNEVEYAKIKLAITNGAVGGHSGDLIFSTASGGSIVERIRLTSAGALGIGCNPSCQLDVINSARIYGAINSDQQWDAGGVVKGYAQSNTSNAYFCFGTISNHPLVFLTNGSERMRIAADGTLYINGVQYTQIDTNAFSRRNPTTSTYLALPETWVRVAASAVGIGANHAVLNISYDEEGVGTGKGTISLSVGCTDGQHGSVSIKLLGMSGRGTCITKARVVYNTTASGNYAYVEIYNANSANVGVVTEILDSYGWLTAQTDGGIPGGYVAQELDLTAQNLNHGRQRFTSDGTWTCPPGVTKVWVTGAGGGGGGGAGEYSGGTCIGGGGGGGGAAVVGQVLTVVPGAVYSITIGAGGAGGVDGNGSSGGTTTFDSLLSLSGGAGGVDAGGTGYGGAAGGTGGQVGTMQPYRSASIAVGGNGGGNVAGGVGGAGQSYAASAGQLGGGGSGGGALENSPSNGGAGGTGYLLVEW